MKQIGKSIILLLSSFVCGCQNAIKKSRKLTSVDKNVNFLDVNFHTLYQHFKKRKAQESSYNFGFLYLIFAAGMNYI